MARFLLGSTPATGHVAPAYPIASELIMRGHEVWWYGGKKFQANIEATGARFVPMVKAYDFDDSNFDRAFPGRTEAKGLAKAKFDVRHVFLDPVAGQVSDLEAILAAFPADVILSDFTLANAIVTERGGPPSANYSVSFLPIDSRDLPPAGMGILPSASRIGKLRNRVIKHIGNMLFRPEQAYYMQIRAALGLPRNNRPLTAQFAQYLYLQGSTETFEYPRSDLPSYVHFVGPLLPPRLANFSPPAWWGELTGGRPVVLVTQGTLATDPNALIVPTLQALANEDVLVIATANPAKLGGIPANTRCEPFIPFMELMPFVSVLVTNGGYGGAQTALAHGVPIVAAGATEDKPEIANRIQWSGVGLNLKTATPTTEQIHSAVKTTLLNSRYRQNAQRIQVDIARHNSPAEAAALLEQLAATRQPVHRDGVQSLAGTATR